MKSIDVTTSDDGVPIFFALDGQIWLVGPQPVRWFERVSWWETKARMSIRGPGNRIDVDVWPLQAALPAILEARRHVVRNAPRIAREPVDVPTWPHTGKTTRMPHVLGLGDPDMIAEHFKFGDKGARYPGGWGARGKLLPQPAGVLGARRASGPSKM